MILSALPGDVLGLIFSRLDTSFLLLDLWLCGDTLLNSKLASNVTAIEMVSAGSSAEPPQFLAHLRRLRELELSASFLYFPKESECVERWSKSIHTLRLKGSSSYKAFLPQASMLAGAHPNFFIDLASLFPLLTTLELHDPSYMNSCKITSKLSFLPPTLTTLMMDCITVTSDDLPFMAALPRTLIRLDVRLMLNCFQSMERFEDDWSNAPPHLEYIHHLHCQGVPTTLRWIPASMRIGLLGGTTQFAWNSAMASSLVAQVDELRLDSVGAHLDLGPRDAMLPRTLKSLAWNSVAPPAFPDSLTSLTWNTVHSTDNLNVPLNALYADRSLAGSFWPSKLTHLTLRDYKIPSKMLEILPRTLLYIDIFIQDQQGEMVTLNAATFPPNLTSAHLCFVNAHMVSFAGQLPISMTSLDLGPVFNHAIKLDAEPLAILNTSSLTTLEVFLSLDSDYFPFPPHLTKLNIDGMRPSWLKALPRTLTFLQSTCLFESESNESNERSDDFEHLPPRLETLMINEGANTFERKFTAASFSSVPSLRVLNILGLGTFPSATLRSLPRRMRELYIRLEKIEVKDLPFIPSNLANFQVCELGEDTAEYEDLQATYDAWPAAALTDMPFSLMAGAK